MAEFFRNDPGFAVDILNAIFADSDDQGELASVMHQLAMAFGGDGAVFDAPNPGSVPPKARELTLASLLAILKTMGFCLTVQAMPSPASL
ncbi:MAG: addiction module antidote protein [Pseudomonadota bacterium]